MTCLYTLLLNLERAKGYIRELDACVRCFKSACSIRSLNRLYMLQLVSCDGFLLVGTREESLRTVGMGGFLEVEVPSLNQKGHFFFFVPASFGVFFSLADCCTLLSAFIVSSRFPSCTAVCIAC